MNKIPEILAPAGGMEQFFAALNAGADAVFLGLKKFNARGRAGNFTLDELRQISPIAKEKGVKILLTLNIVLKQKEIPEILDLLSELSTSGIHAVIVQDLGLVKIIKEYFPNLRIHASTQMAIHNDLGVSYAAKLGIHRVVLARELTFQEIGAISKKSQSQGVELEAFCHGSLCYSYSGLCFFSGIEDARSGNRGECAYTCRKPYRIINEPGHGFLFSMKDLSTYESIDRFVAAGVDTLKIEGRKKDAQYVSSSVGLYRSKLNELTGDHSKKPAFDRNYQEDLKFSFQRGETSFFLKGRYHENVIDLSNPSHAGILLGEVLKIKDHWFLIEPSLGVEIHDGLQIEKKDKQIYHAEPQHGSIVQSQIKSAEEKYHNSNKKFSVKKLRGESGQNVFEAPANQKVWIELDEASQHLQVGDKILKIRSNELMRQTHQAIKPPADTRLLALQNLRLVIEVKPSETGLYDLNLRFLTARGEFFYTAAEKVPGEIPLKPDYTCQEDLLNVFSHWGEANLRCQIEVDGEIKVYFPRSRLKSVKKEILPGLTQALTQWYGQARNHYLEQGRNAKALDLKKAPDLQYSIKIDRLEYLSPALSMVGLKEIVFEPKRSSLQLSALRAVLEELVLKTRAQNLAIRLALPMVIRAWDIPYLSRAISWFRDLGGQAYEVGNLGALELLQDSIDLSSADLSSDFTMYALNTEAAALYETMGIHKFALSIEDDYPNIKDLSGHLPVRTKHIRAQAIIYKDTPLFIAESCSLTALHNGCPGPKTCGYRTLEIENEEGERYEVAHENCRTIVYGKKAFSISQFQDRLKDLQITDFRIDFLTRRYQESEILSILHNIASHKPVPETHTGNFLQELL